MDLEIEHRKNSRGEPCVAPFINGWNVWDIPEKEWTQAVQRAVLHAYEVGWRHCMLEVQKKVGPCYAPPDWSKARLCSKEE